MEIKSLLNALNKLCNESGNGWKVSGIFHSTGVFDAYKSHVDFLKPASKAKKVYKLITVEFIEIPNGIQFTSKPLLNKTVLVNENKPNENSTLHQN